MPPDLKALGDASSRLTRTDSNVPEKTHRAIQDCFVSPPLRYLCSRAIEQHPQATDLWIVRNRRITALMGLWKLSSDAAYYERAFAEAKLILESKSPAGTEVVARFCIAREALRKADAQPKQVIADFLTSLGGEQAPGTALAAAALLALEVGDRTLHENYRKIILERHAEQPAMWSTVSFLLDRNHRYWLSGSFFCRLVIREGIVFLSSDAMVTNDQGLAFGEQISALGNSYKKLFGGDDAPFYYTIPSKEIAPKITTPQQIKGRHTGVESKTWSDGADIQNLIDQAISKTYQ